MTVCLPGSDPETKIGRMSSLEKYLQEGKNNRGLGEFFEL
jgi:hypothetical protein